MSRSAWRREPPTRRTFPAEPARTSEQSSSPRRRRYNLKILGAAKSGDYLAGVKVTIESAKKERVLDTTMDGPILLAKLAPGTYTIRATSGSQTLTQTVTIAGQGLRQVNFRWDIPK